MELYILVSGSRWRELPINLPNWYSVYKYFRKLKALKLFDLIQSKLSSFFSKGLIIPLKHILITDSQSVGCTNMLKGGFKGR